MTDLAVILAAGRGSRLGDKTKDMPKGLLEVGGISLVQRSLNQLRKSGIREVILVTGYKSEAWSILEWPDEAIHFVHNENWSRTGSMGSLLCATERISRSFILLESDLLYHISALEHLLNSDTKTTVLGSGPTHSNDEVFIQLDPSNTIQAMSKDKARLKHVSAELVGISKIDNKTFLDWQDHAFRQKEDPRLLDYEESITQFSQDSHSIQVDILEDLIWCEIDDDHHLERALKYILPSI